MQKRRNADSTDHVRSHFPNCPRHWCLQNHIDVTATIFADLLVEPNGRFKDVLQTVVFAILGKETVK